MRQRGFGLIETMRVRAGSIPFLERHLARLARSRTALGLPEPTQDIAALVRPFVEMDDAVLRVELADGRATVTVRALPSLEPPSVITASQRHERYEHKSTERDCFDEAAEEADNAEADDALLVTHDGCVAEGTVWTVLWWGGGKGEGGRVNLYTPALDLGVLPGIGRARVAELMPIVETRARRAELDDKSVFLVNAVRGVVPLKALDGVPVPSDPSTAELARNFWPVS
jgi:branched-subunit amino acid aminotransferase/4-amino-4-deoxychorismate lyase